MMHFRNFFLMTCAFLLSFTLTSNAMNNENEELKEEKNELYQAEQLNETEKEILQQWLTKNKYPDNDPKLLFYAIEQDNVGLVALLIKKDKKLVNKRNSYGSTPLMDLLKIQSNKKLKAEVIQEIAQLLISAGTDLNAQDGHGFTALMRAPMFFRSSLYDYFEVAKAIIKTGAFDVNIQNNIGGTAFYYAVNDRDLTLLQDLIAAGADIMPTTRNPRGGRHTALSVAQNNRWQEAVDYLQPFYDFKMRNDEGKVQFFYTTNIPLKERQDIYSWFLKQALTNKKTINPDIKVLCEMYSNYKKHVHEDDEYMEFTSTVDAKDTFNLLEICNRKKVSSFDLGFNYL